MSSAGIESWSASNKKAASRPRAYAMLAFRAAPMPRLKPRSSNVIPKLPVASRRGHDFSRSGYREFAALHVWCSLILGRRVSQPGGQLRCRGLRARPTDRNQRGTVSGVTKSG